MEKGRAAGASEVYPRSEPGAPRDDRSGYRIGVNYRILGPLEVVFDGRMADLGSAKQRAVLAALLLRANEIVPTDHLIEAVWGEEPPRTAAHSIQIYVSALRAVFEAMASGPIIVTRAPGYLLQAESESIDAHRFEQLVDWGRRDVQQGDPTRGIERLMQALQLWRGPALTDVMYEEFAQGHVRRLEGIRLEALEELASAQLNLGNEHEALAILDALIMDHPLRERPRALQMTAQYRSGRQAEALRGYQGFRRLLADEMGIEPSAQLRELEERILLQDPTLIAARPGAEVSTEVRNPFKGLRPFLEADAADFFGRQQVVEQLCNLMANGQSFISLVGPSGCGKSSLVRAGLIPALRVGAVPGSELWVIEEMNSSSVSLLDLERATLREQGGNHQLILIDQFEELFTSVDEETRSRFLETLTWAARSNQSHLTVVTTLRADFYDRPLLDPNFAESFIGGVVNVLPLTPGELEAAIVEPARRSGVEVDSALLAELVADTVGQAGGLPLFQYSLTELFDRRTQPKLTLEAYRTLGGLRRAISRRAEQLFDGFDEEQKEVARQVFLRLVKLGEGTKDVRRRVLVSELIALEFDPAALASLFDGFGRHRLLTYDRDHLTGAATVEVAHEALLVEWERLAGWIEAHRSDLRRHDALIVAVAEWEESGRQPDYLLAGSRLTLYDQWTEAEGLRLTTSERAFVAASIAKHEKDQVEEASRLSTAEKLNKRVRNRARALAGLAVLLVATGILLIQIWEASRPPDVALLFGGRGDGGYYDMVAAGFDRVVSDFELDASEVPVASSSPETELERLSAGGVRMIVVAGPIDYYLVSDLAVKYRDTSYAVIWSNETLNQGSLTFHRNLAVSYFAFEEGAFLMGAAAAFNTQTGKVGFIGGAYTEWIRSYFAGFEAGARYINPEIEISRTYLTETFDPSGFSSPTLAGLAASEMYREGVDVIFHAAGLAGLGVFDAAVTESRSQERHLWAIGSDGDQYHTVDGRPVVLYHPPSLWKRHILTSLISRYDLAVETAVKTLDADIFHYENQIFDLGTGGLEYSTSGGYIDDIIPDLEALKGMIISGEIEVPSIPLEIRER